MFNVRIEGPLHVVYDDAIADPAKATIKECTSAREAAIFVGTEKAGDVGNLAQHLLKKYGDAHLFTDCMGDETTGEYDHDTRAAVCARVHHEATGKWPTEKEMKEVHEMKELFNAQEMREEGRKVVIDSLAADGISKPTEKQINDRAIELLRGEKAEWTAAAVNDLPDSSFLYIESGGDKDEGGKTIPRSLRHFPYKDADGKVDLPHLRNAIARIPQSNAPGLNKDAVQKRAQKILADNTDAESADAKKEHDPSWLAKFAAIFTPKEGRRNATSDQDHIDQAHDHLVAAGAKCPMMVMKDASGKSRWVLVSTNAYEDRDGEYVSRKAQKRDVERMTETKQYGPLRLWHLGYPDVEKKEAGPGVDIGDCDYSQMFGKFRVESGTFRNERIAAAIKERADRWATSVGFFHPQNEPDPSGTYHEIYTFERSLLPRTKASNLLTPLAAIIKELAMTTKEDKVNQLTALLGDDKLAQDVLGQVDKMEKEAQKRGLTFKQADDVTEKTSAKKVGAGDGEPDEDDLSDMDEATQKAYNTMLPHIVKAIHNLTKKDNIEGKKERKAAKKERKATQDKIDQIAQAIAELKGELPRGLARGGYQPSQSKENLITLAGVPTMKENVPDPLGDFMTNLMNFDPKTMSGTPTTGQ